ncbi:hypothetical protein C1280_19620 [Gemmata obscuriglobus]|uniref:Uncharacterized protein n=1 Tax=Gemmata obscuriglobus TaxID=114 RepID=A0A2Z3H7M2_9BACT|nr:hypothetical protein C1280_19620 [Gemmata obscuriglobus]
MLEKLGHIRLLARRHPSRRGGVLFAGATTLARADRRQDVLTHVSQRTRDGLIDLLEDMEHAERVRHARPALRKDGRVPRRAIGGNALHTLATGAQLALNVRPKDPDIGVGRVVFEDTTGQAVVPAVVHN